MKRLTKVLAAGAVLALVGGAGAQAQESLKVGVLVPTTGSEATYGQDMYNAAAIARDEINAHGGVLGKKIELIVGDDGCDPQQAVNAAAKIVSQKVAVVVGGYCSGATVPTLKVPSSSPQPIRRRSFPPIRAMPS
jgi:branched-chain amino acid transport system substrate-binding protein